MDSDLFSAFGVVCIIVLFVFLLSAAIINTAELISRERECFRYGHCKYDEANNVVWWSDEKESK